MKAVRLTIWDRQAETFNAGVGAVFVGKHLKIAEFQGRCLTSTLLSSFLINPQIREAILIQEWWNNLDQDMLFDHLSSISDMIAIQPTSLLRKIKEIHDFTKEKVERFNTQATVLTIRDNPTYPACPRPSCRKRVTPCDGQWYCEKCRSSFSHPKYRYIMKCCIADFTAELWVTIFNTQGETIFQRPALQYETLKVLSRLTVG
ncbi:Replication factor A protein 1 [Entomophthora muscae]|uniref:Replication factor A protein 1 n=1 Tax=Entomophthora muscae TaxID=34485 RepID=A0ACC2RIX0_9FUNG|nr:Replication factor A protein 1 [Entomophthora muscae]